MIRLAPYLLVGWGLVAVCVLVLWLAVAFWLELRGWLRERRERPRRWFVRRTGARS